MGKRLKEQLSKKLLDFVEMLPQFRGGTIATLQAIRERQKRWSKETRPQRTIPENVRMELTQLTLVIMFEFEEFRSIQAGIRKVFSGNEKVQDFVEDLKKTENRLQSLSWNRVGLIARESGSHVGVTEVDDSLPACSNYASVSYHRILPSLAAIEIDFGISKDVRNRLTKIQQREYLDPIVFKKLWPLNRIPFSYSSGIGSSEASKAISTELLSLKTKLIKWVSSSFGWRAELGSSISCVHVYELSGIPTDHSELGQWQRDNHNWLEDFGIDIRDYNTYSNDEIICARTRPTDAFSKGTNVLVRLKTQRNREPVDPLQFQIGSVAVSGCLYSLIDSYRTDLETLRARGFKALGNPKRGVLRNAPNLQGLKRLTTKINRLDHEISQASHWIRHTISEIGPLKDWQEKDVSLDAIVAENVQFQIRQIKSSADIIDSGLTNYLSVQSISTMYALQVWIFVLTIVVTIATVVGVLASWNNLKSIILAILSVLRH